MGKLAWLGIAVVCLIGLPTISAVVTPKEFLVSRSRVIDASPEQIYPLIASPRKMNEWNPFVEDPEMTLRYSGPESGPGSRNDWTSTGAGGAGSMEITRVEEPHRVEIRLTFLRPFAATNLAAFSLRPEGDGTEVTWEMSGTRPLPMRALRVFFDGDAMVGGEFEKGLAELARSVEGR